MPPDLLGLLVLRASRVSPVSRETRESPVRRAARDPPVSKVLAEQRGHREPQVCPDLQGHRAVQVLPDPPDPLVLPDQLGCEDRPVRRGQPG